jgi:hypothetical protein
MPSFVRAQDARPASIVERAAAVIESKYFDEAKAKAIAARLREAVAQGEFDAMTDPRELAAALSLRLGREDGHLRAVWMPDRSVQAQGSPRSDRMPEEVRASRWNFGFRRIEILPGNLGLIELSEFADFDAGAEWDAAPRRVADAALAVVEQTDALILDLRDNGGGGAMADYLLSYFLPPDVLLSEMRGRTTRRESRTLTRVGGRRRLDVPLFVLVSGLTASAAEFFAYSLQGMKRATVVGERTAGAANPGMTFDIGEGFEIFVPLDTPVNHYTGTNWEGVGVKPDIAVQTEQALVRAQAAALEETLRRGLPPTEARDARWVLEALTSPNTVPVDSLQDFSGTYGNRVVRIDGGELSIQRARWPARRLRPLGRDLFVLERAPWRRVAFERRDGKVIGLVELTSAGDETRLRKDAP